MGETRTLRKMSTKQVAKTQFCSLVLVIMTQTGAEDLGHQNPIGRWVWFCRRSYMTLTLIIGFLKKRVIPLCMLIPFIELCTQELLFTKMSELSKFRVSGEGFQNRYRNRDNLYPHVDQAYACIYPGKDNSDYTNDDNRNNRRMNKKLDTYNVGQQVNGIFHMQVIEATPE
uniref:Uncharacterized protein LOC111118737 isoform X1 n=1 Tax=Crassostrea virginica TaxID=6565 RepID=A0A8B8CEC8_CRAVI|nr:uncharacterized protein LOC111118737 isoform X1 [Crassostrea virginica]